MNSILSLIRGILPTSMQNLHDLAINHSPAILFLLYLFIVIFTVLSIFFFIPIWRKSAVHNAMHNAMRFAPSIMTTLGLLGTFWGLTEALTNFGIEQIENFMKQLEGIFVFSLFGIGSALGFMLINTLINSFQSSKNRQLYQRRKDEETNYRSNLQENNRQVVGNLTQQTKFADIQQENAVKQSDYLYKIGNLLLKNRQDDGNNQQANFDTLKEQNSLLKNIANKNNEQIRLQSQLPTNIENTNHILSQLVAKNEKINQDTHVLFTENNRMLADILDNHHQQLTKQLEFNQVIDKHLEDLATSFQGLKGNFDTNKLGEAIGQYINAALIEPLGKISEPLERMLALMENDNNDKIKQLIEELKNEIKTTNSSVLLVTAAVKQSDETNGKMIDALVDTTNVMKLVTDKTEQVVTRMETLQKDQKTHLEKFNDDLQNNLGKIKPAIEDGMKNAENALTGAINAASDNMNKTLTTTQGYIQTVAEGINDTVNTMGTIQKDQKVALDEFNSKLKDNLGTIKPAITDSMKVAEVALTGAIALAMKEMNSTLKDTQNAMSEIIGQMSKDVLTRIENVLNSFNTGMDTHLNRMNTELEQTGNRASNLMTQTADNLERSLGDIHKTIHDSSNVLQKELQEFREQYQLNLNDFFDKQNKALELTLGEQNKALQTTANELNTQFTNMTTAQQDLLVTQQALNNDLNRIKTEFDQVYSGLLIKMTTLADTLSKNENRYLKSLGDTNKEMQEINKALMDMGHQLPKEFATAFEKLNEAYETRFNELNEKSHTFMGQIVAATGALIQTVTALKDQA